MNVRFHEGRLALGIVLFALYSAGSVWVIHRQGTAYRRNVIDSERANTVNHPLESASNSRVRKPVSRSTPDLNAGRKGTHALRGPRARDVTDTPSGTPVIPPASTPNRKETSVAATSDSEVPIRGKSVPLPEHDPFWDSPDMKEVLAVDHLDARAEGAIGARIHEIICRFHPPSTDASLSTRLHEAAEPFLPTVKRKDLNYTFTVLESDAVNAFSHLGGYVYATRGLLSLIGEDEDYVLEFVVGHEIAHVDLQHMVQCLRDPGVARLGMGTIAKVYLIIIPFGYLDAQDYEADRWVSERMAARESSPFEIKAFLRRYEQFARDHGFAGGRAAPEVKAGTSPLDNHLRAHVSARSRLQKLVPDPPAQSQPTK